MKDRNGIRLKIDVTPKWWKREPGDRFEGDLKHQVTGADVFAEWCVKAVRLILGTWPRAEIRLSREKVYAVVSFDGEERVAMVSIDKKRLKEDLDQISEPKADNEPDSVKYGQDEQGRT